MPWSCADIQTKRARCLSGLPPLNNAGSESRTAPPPAAWHWWSLYADEYKSILHHLALDAFCPALVPAIQENAGQIRQNRSGQVAGFHKSRSGTCGSKSRCRFAPVPALPVVLDPVAADYSSVPPLVTRSTAYMVPPVFVQDHPPEEKPAPRCTLNMQGGKDGATANIPTKTRLTGDVLWGWLLPLPLPALLPVGDRKMVASRDAGMISALRTVRRSATGQDVLTVQSFFHHVQRVFSAVPSPFAAKDSQHHLCRCRAGCWHPPPDRQRFGHEIHKLQLAPTESPSKAAGTQT